MSANITAAETALRAAGFKVTRPVTAGAPVLAVAVDPTSERLFDLLPVVAGLAGSFVVYPGGVEGTTCLAEQG